MAGLQVGVGVGVFPVGVGVVVLVRVGVGVGLLLGPVTVIFVSVEPVDWHVRPSDKVAVAQTAVDPPPFR
jgi:hypothetical protein